MSDRERAVQLLNSVPDDKTEIPNKNTIEAIEELENGGGEVFEGSAHDFLQMMLKECKDAKNKDHDLKGNYRGFHK
ncbi:MAG: hypothetical protein HDR07_00890 [Lachnospiraceae bacterium]|nr:hypothetical protein [Lachnospiraceae bacterium]